MTTARRRLRGVIRAGQLPLGPLDALLAVAVAMLSAVLVVLAARSADEFFDSPWYGRSWLILGAATLVLGAVRPGRAGWWGLSATLPQLVAFGHLLVTSDESGPLWAVGLTFVLMLWPWCAGAAVLGQAVAGPLRRRTATPD